MNKLSDWQNVYTLPKVFGVYQRHYIQNNVIWYCYFFNGLWYLNAETPEEAYDYYLKDIVALCQNLPWRGVIDE